jgi:hypothetical protein
VIDSAASSTPSRALSATVRVPPVGRSRLAGPDGYATAAAQLRSRIRGGAIPDPLLLERLWSPRERRAVSLLALALRAGGVAVSGLHVRAALAEAARARRPLRR